MTDSLLLQIRDVIQEDVGNRGLKTDPQRNLINAFPDDFESACMNIAAHPEPAVAIVTGFLIPDAVPPAGETDGPLGALFLARALDSLGIETAILTDFYCKSALAAGLQECGLSKKIPLMILPIEYQNWFQFLPKGWLPFARDRFHLTHLIGIERPGPSHTLESFQKQIFDQTNDLGEQYLFFLNEVPPENQDKYFTMSGIDITQKVSPAHLLFESVKLWFPEVTTIGIGDGGNEIGMGKLSWDLIQRNIPRGGKIACRIPTDYLVVSGVSNWGAYGLAAGITLLLDKPLDKDLFSAERERQLLQLMVEKGPLVDGVTKNQIASVDGLDFEKYILPLQRIVEICKT